jgi:molybdopterin-guanine dinucleotide biosynthesis protein A
LKSQISNLKFQIPALYGLVLAGGRSLRMKTDKATLQYHDKMQSEHCFEMLSSVCQEVYLSNRKEQESWVGYRGLPQINDRYEGTGPLVGILSAMRTHPQAAWLVVACDMPFLDSRLIGELVRERDPSRNATAFIASDSGPEPLCAIYEPSSFPILMNCLGNPDEGPRVALMNAEVRLVEPDHPASLMNVNFAGQRDAILQVRLEEGPMKTIHVRYYAALRDERGCASEEIQTAARSPLELFQELRARHGLSLSRESLRVAVNDEFGDWSELLADGDGVAFIPPVAGG